MLQDGFTRGRTRRDASSRRFWLQLLLVATTSRWRPDPRLPLEALDLIADARAQGWAIRRAAPRYDVIWSRETRTCRLLRTLILPDRTARLTPREHAAVIRDRSALCGLALEGVKGDPRASASAERKMRAALAPEWLGRGAALDIVTKEEVRHGHGLEGD